MATNNEERHGSEDRFTDGYELGMMECAQMLACVATDYSPEAVEDVACHIASEIMERRIRRNLAKTGMDKWAKVVADNVAYIEDKKEAEKMTEAKAAWAKENGIEAATPQSVEQ